MRNFNEIGMIGDLHANHVAALVAIHALGKAGITEAIQLGDFGGWSDPDAEAYAGEIQKAAMLYGLTLYVVDGNHENHVYLDSLPRNKKDGLRRLRRNIIILDRGYRWEWAGRSFVALGGANSIDRYSRTPNISWFAEESITLGDVYNTLAGGHAEVMVTHECPAGAQPLRHGASDSEWPWDGLKYARESAAAMRQAVDGVKPTMLFHGHYHFFHDTTTILNDGVEDYTTRVIGMDQDGHDNNVGILTLADLSFRTIPVV
jgi:hypothetical protein